ncbi:MAG: metalloregulator ArsR/SmtB family transcription factor [Proteobacteria bacterium]|nr:metalloregulator ArsR/SmtB family transcription factor [Pseudomonadota bacterium]
MSKFFHPRTDDLQLPSILAALGDDIRLCIVRKLAEGEALACQNCAPDGVAPSTLSYHFKILRDAGLIKTEKRGVSHYNSLRAADVEQRFPGLLHAVLTEHNQNK